MGFSGIYWDIMINGTNGGEVMGIWMVYGQKWMVYGYNIILNKPYVQMNVMVMEWE